MLHSFSVVEIFFPFCLSFEWTGIPCLPRINQHRHYYSYEIGRIRRLNMFVLLIYRLKTTCSTAKFNKHYMKFPLYWGNTATKYKWKLCIFIELPFCLGKTVDSQWKFPELLGEEKDFQAAKKFKYFVYNKRRNTFAFVFRVSRCVLTEPATPKQTDKQAELSTQHMRFNWLYLSLSLSRLCAWFLSQHSN